MRLLEVGRKELRHKRVSCLAIFCVANLLLLSLAAWLPRTYTVTAELRFDAAGENADNVIAGVRKQLKKLTESGPDLDIRRSGTALELSAAASSARKAFRSLDDALTTLIRVEMNTLQLAREDAVRSAAAAVTESSNRLGELQLKINDVLQAVPEGGESGAGARIGQLQGAMDSLVLTVRSDEERMVKNRGRLEAIDQRLDMLRSNSEMFRQRTPQDVAREQSQFETERQLLMVALTQAEQDLALKKQQLVRLRSLLYRARSEAAEMHKENQVLDDLRRQYETAVALDRQLILRLQQMKLETAVAPTLEALPFAVSRHPVMPDRADGLSRPVISVAVLVGGLMLMTIKLLASVLFDKRVRMPDALVAGAEVPVLSVIPDYQPLRAASDLRWQSISAVLLLAVVAAAHVAFLLGKAGVA
jgi:hypothetical protein